LTEVENVLAIGVVPLTCPEERDGLGSQRVVGVLAAAMHHAHSWEPRQKRLLTTIANQMAFAVKNAQLYAQANKNMAPLGISNQVLQEINNLLIVK
jgi:GAF domain-containing protein